MTRSLGETFAGRRVLVTGHTGFKGGWLCTWLHELGAQVTGYSLPPPTQPSLFEIAGVARLLAQDIRGDVRDAERLEAALAASGAEVIFHLAAQPLVREGYRLPRETFEVNAIGTASLLDAVRAVRRPCVVVVVTSDKCYENIGRGREFVEGDRLGGHEPYGASKAAAELVIAAYRASFFPPERLRDHGVRLASVRAGNVIGGGDWAKDRLVTDIVRHLVAGEPVPVRNPTAVRPWQHVLEPLSGYLQLAARLLADDDPRLCDAWNFGPLVEDTLTVADLVQLFVAGWGAPSSWVSAPDPTGPREATVLRLSSERAVSLLGWHPTWEVREAVTRTVRWYRRYYQDRADMGQACVDDLGDFAAAGISESAS